MTQGNGTDEKVEAFTERKKALGWRTDLQEWRFVKPQVLLQLSAASDRRLENVPGTAPVAVRTG